MGLIGIGTLAYSLALTPIPRQNLSAGPSTPKMPARLPSGASEPRTPASEPNVKYHYTHAAESSFKEGLRAQSSVTDNPDLTPTEAIEKLGLRASQPKLLPIFLRATFKTPF
jgi:hypothetical protein